MFQVLVQVLMACAMAGSTVATALPQVGGTPVSLQPPPDADFKVTYRQASREGILRRSESRKIAARAGALQPRQSARVYPTCSSSDPAYIPQSGFVNFPEYSIGTAAANFLDGYFINTSPEISCVMLCQTTSGCTAGYWAGGNTCYLRQGTIPGTNMVPRPGTDRVAFIKGDCASLEGSINNSTIMEACCNNPPPSTIARCTFAGYQNRGPYCLQTRLVYGTANRLTSVTVAGGTDNTAVLTNCARACTDWTASARTDSRHTGCTIASYNSVTTGANCVLYGGALSSMAQGADSPNTSTFIAGTCEQVAANNVPDRPAGGGCYSNLSGP